MKARRRKARRYTGKKKNNRDRTILKVVLLIAFIALVVFLTIRLGLHLREKAMFSEEMRGDDTLPPEKTHAATDNGDYLHNAEIKLDGKYISLEGIKSHDEYNEAVSSVAEGDFVSLTFRDTNGNLAFSSSTAQNLGGQDADCGLLSADEIIKPLKDKGCTVCAVFGLIAYQYEESAEAEAMHAFEHAIISELSSSGIDEIMLCGMVFSSDEDIAYCAKQGDNISSKYAGNAKLGLLIPYSAFSDDNGNKLCRALAPAFDFLAVDYTSVPEEDDAAEEIAELADSMQIFFSRYSVRAVLDPEKSNSSFEYEALKEASVYQVQAVYAKDVFTAE